MRRAVDQLGLQLLFTAAPKDKSALSMFDRVSTFACRHRPSFGRSFRQARIGDSGRPRAR